MKPFAPSLRNSALSGVCAPTGALVGNHGQIEVAVVVVVTPISADCVILDAHAERLADFGERAVVVVAIQQVVTVVGREDVEIAVVVVVANGTAHAAFLFCPRRAGHAERGGDVSE